MDTQYPISEQESTPIYEQSLGRNPTPAEIQQLATGICRQQLQTEGMTP
jgi:hypothetical protein